MSSSGHSGRWRGRYLSQPRVLIGRPSIVVRGDYAGPRRSSRWWPSSRSRAVRPAPPWCRKRCGDTLDWIAPQEHRHKRRPHQRTATSSKGWSKVAHYSLSLRLARPRYPCRQVASRLLHDHLRAAYRIEETRPDLLTATLTGWHGAVGITALLETSAATARWRVPLRGQRHGCREAADRAPARATEVHLCQQGALRPHRPGRLLVVCNAVRGNVALTPASAPRPAAAGSAPSRARTPPRSLRRRSTPSSACRPVVGRWGGRRTAPRRAALRGGRARPTTQPSGVAACNSSQAAAATGSIKCHAGRRAGSTSGCRCHARRPRSGRWPSAPDAA